ncbi:hypothetical protein KBX31_08415 [Liquorilactobacillus satsumensis]|uniref:hypothetical protein n=2 Tax=Liquorilactobacillus satsumensis TaxID=259059 RepID=UPI0021C4C24A|nr:hypothetical protein [Liquorilactobacillus satsumensis]MCP9313302.1 hypothetical protein [Liquorilactobacillus satsumensis]MCP9360448.1 hypothetical protein [Liquorilactobacillus satsumensis]
MEKKSLSKTSELPLMLGYFVFSIFLNSLGNALTVSLNLGSALWTAAAVNVAHAAALQLSWILFVEGFLVILLNLFLVGHLSVRRVVGNLIFMVSFSYLVGGLSGELVTLGIGNLALPLRIVLDCVGIVLIATAISIYQRVNLIMHPCDDLMQILRFKFFKGNPSTAQLVSFIPPIVAIGVVFGFTQQIFALNIGTIFALIFQGALVGIADQRVFPTLRHHDLEI